jgi:hypothetical protein
MLSLIKSLILHRNTRSVAERERDYLDAAVSRFDLERREREIDGGLFRR